MLTCFLGLSTLYVITTLVFMLTRYDDRYLENLDEKLQENLTHVKDD